MKINQHSELKLFLIYFIAVSDDTCDQQKPKCRETGGVCIHDVDEKNIMCDCTAGLIYDETTGCSGKFMRVL